MIELGLFVFKFIILPRKSLKDQPNTFTSSIEVVCTTSALPMYYQYGNKNVISNSEIEWPGVENML